MLKAFGFSFAMMIVVAVVIWSGVLDVFNSKATLYLALVFLAIVLVAAFIILGNPINGLKDNDKKSD